MQRFPLRLSLLTLSVAIASSTAWAQQDALVAGFNAPPDSAKPHTWWHWMNGNVSKAGITADLESMKRVGIGGAHLAQVGTGIPKGPVPYDSPETTQLVQFAYQEANRLNLDLCLFNCPGWSSSGGPWITPADSMKVLVYTEATVSGGQAVSVALKQPEATREFYKDAFVVAYPTPAADSRIPNFNNGSGGGRGGRGRGNAPTASVPSPSSVAAIDPSKVLDLTANMSANGQLNWNAPPGDWMVLRVGFTTNGTQNRPAPDGGGGLEVDKYSREALDTHFKTFFGPFFDVMKPLADKGKAAALIDSYETGSQTWTDKFPEEFKKRRGYDMTSYMPAMAMGRVVGSVDISQRFLWDVRKTQAELMDEYYYGHFTELCHERSMASYFEPYDTVNFDEMMAGAYADMPMGEFWQGQANHRSIKAVASVAHVNGRSIMGAESFTSQSRWTESPYSLRAVGDFMWTQGLNKFVFHRFAMQPNADPSVFPGMTMGPWGGHFDRTNTWFEPGKAWMQYIARSQFLLQQGVFAGELAYFVGEDSPVRTTDQGQLNPAPPKGYGFDSIDVGTLRKRVKIVGARITLPDGLAYRVLVLPPTIRIMTVETIQNLHDLVDAGMTLVVNGPKPEQTPSLMNYPRDDATVARVANDLWGNLDGTTTTEHTLGKGHVYWGVPLADVLRQKLGAKPDFESTSRSGTADINYIHRHIGATELYFVANRGQKSEELVCTFNVAGKQPEFWDAVTGQRIAASVYDLADGRTSIPLQLPPSGSMFVLFRETARASHLTAISSGDKVLASVDPLSASAPPTTQAGRGLGAGGGGGFGRVNVIPLPTADAPLPVQITTASTPLVWENGPYALRNAQGQSQTRQIADLPLPAELTGPWQVTFPPKLGAPPEANFDKLISWPESSDDGIKYFSGTATYTRKLNVPAERLGSGKRLFLDLGRVLVLAQVFVNGKDLGILWTLPYRVDIADAVHVGENDLEIRVTNLWPNRLIGDEQLPAENQYGGRGGRGGGQGGGGGGGGAISAIPQWYAQGLPKPEGSRITFTTWHHWNANDTLLESGLIGPVMLRTAVPLTP